MRRLDPNDPKTGDFAYADIDQGIAGIQNKFSKIPAWDSKWKLNWVRYFFIPIMAVPAIESGLRMYAEFRHTTYNQVIDGLPIVPYWILSLLWYSFFWLYETGLLGLLVILSAWGFLVTASKLSKSERNLRQKISKRDVFGSALNFTFLFLGVKYLYPGMHGAFYFILIALVLGEFFRIPLLRRYQRHYGPLDVERFQKKTARRTRKQEEANHFKNGPKKKKHGRQ